MPETRDLAARRPNLPGAVLLAGSLVAIVYPLLEGRQLGWPAWVWPLIGAGLAGLCALGLLEARRSGRQANGVNGVAPLLQAGLFRIPAFAAGMGVQLAFAVGLQGFFLAFTLWLQIGEHFSPLKAGLSAVAFSVGSFAAAPAAVPLAQRHGRRVLASGLIDHGRPSGTSRPIPLARRESNISLGWPAWWPGGSADLGRPSSRLHSNG